MDWGHHVRPGTTLAIYMGVAAAAGISSELQAKGASPGTRVEVAVEVSTQRERLISCDLASLADVLDENGVAGVALILIQIPKRGIERRSKAA